jgi:molybdopterin molybdotransferase
MISEEEARESILRTIRPLREREAPLRIALDSFAAHDYVARVSLPVFDNSAMDGYAVIAADCRVGVGLRVAGEQPAGINRQLQLHAGEAIRIFTGAPIPAGADAVVMQEDVDRQGDVIRLNTVIDPGESIRQRGCDLSEGQKILSRGERIRAGTLALLASQGIAEVMIGGKVGVAIVSTGDELVKLGEPLQPGQIYESNSVLLQALIERCGAVVESTLNCRDDRDLLIDAIRKGARQPVLIVTGGVSVGEHDLVRAAFQALGGQIDVWRVAIKPGKPFLFGHLDQCAVFGLPGNPVSAFVTFLKFVRPAVLKMMGAGDLDLRRISARLNEDLRNEGDRIHYVRGQFDGETFAPIGRQESGEELQAGATVTVEMWD